MATLSKDCFDRKTQDAACDAAGLAYDADYIFGLPGESVADHKEAALRFARQLQSRFNRPVATIDERLSSWEAGQRRADRGIKSGRRQDAALDATAAAVILETWFHHLRSAETCAMPSS